MQPMHFSCLSLWAEAAHSGILQKAISCKYHVARTLSRVKRHLPSHSYELMKCVSVNPLGKAMSSNTETRQMS